SRQRRRARPGKPPADALGDARLALDEVHEPVWRHGARPARDGPPPGARLRRAFHHGDEDAVARAGRAGLAGPDGRGSAAVLAHCDADGSGAAAKLRTPMVSPIRPGATRGCWATALHAGRASPKKGSALVSSARSRGRDARWANSF